MGNIHKTIREASHKLRGQIKIGPAADGRVGVFNVEPRLQRRRQGIRPLVVHDWGEPESRVRRTIENICGKNVDVPVIDRGLDLIVVRELLKRGQLALRVRHSASVDAVGAHSLKRDVSDDSKVVRATLESPEQVRVGALAGLHHSAVTEHDAVTHDVVHGEAPVVDEVRKAGAQSKARSYSRETATDDKIAHRLDNLVDLGPGVAHADGHGLPVG